MRFSVIMPVYNVEQYLNAAISSVINQTFSDFELILVDDASPDNCPKICDDFAAKDKRIKVIHNPENCGLGMARNIGFNAAIGEFVIYIDSDDTLTENALEILNEQVDGFDITVFGINRNFEDKNGKTYKSESLSPNPCVTSSLKESGQLLIELNKSGVFPFAWNKAYNRQFLLNANHPFETTKLIEDFLYNVELFQKTEKIKIIKNCLYNYRKPAHQTLANSYSPEFLNLTKRKFLLEKALLNNTGINTDENLQFIYYVFIKHLLSYFVRNRVLSAKEQKQLIKLALCDNDVVLVLNNYRPNGIALKIITKILKTKMVLPCYVLAMIIDTFKK